MPGFLNWVDKGKVTSVKLQGICGASWAFSSTSMLESYNLILHNSNINLDLAEQYLIQCTKDNTCKKGYIKDAMLQIIQGNGMPSENNFHYNPNMTYAGICEAPKLVSSPSKTLIEKFYLSDD